MSEKSDENFKTFLFEYGHRGSRWILEMRAESMEDAKERVAKLPLAKPLGELTMVVPKSAGWIAKAYCVIRNFLRG